MGTPVVVLSGYLGAGKTTLLNGLLANPDGHRIGVVVNDFGSVNVDAALVRSRTEDTIELTDGCICCSLRGEVSNVMRRLAGRDDLDLIVVEASGVADPAGLASWGSFPGLSAGTIVVCADTGQIRRLLRDDYLGDVIEAQVRRAQVLVLTRVDTVATAEIPVAADQVRTLSPHAQILFSTGGDLSPKELLSTTATAAAPTPASSGADPALVPASSGEAAALVAGEEGPTQAEHEDRTISLQEPLDLDVLTQILEELPPEVVRVKGVVNDRTRNGHAALIQRAGTEVTVHREATAVDAHWRGLVLIAFGAEATTLLDRAERSILATVPDGSSRA